MTESSSKHRLVLSLAFACTLIGCAGQRSKPDLPYPAFVETGEIEEQFLATLPGVRARAFYGDPRTRALASRVDIPADWSGSTAAEPGKALEIYVLAGELRLSDFTLGPGGYAWVPPGSLGFKLASDPGAQILYFLDELDERAVMRSPVILDSSLVAWQDAGPGVYELELRRDPGTGARTWLRRVDAGTHQAWQASSVEREGYFLSGQYRQSECAQGKPATWDYLPGGYFRRPAGVLSGGPAAIAVQDSTWFLREKSGGHITLAPDCTAAAEASID
jgi:Domain of unknown function (DUF4437)